MGLLVSCSAIEEPAATDAEVARVGLEVACRERNERASSWIDFCGFAGFCEKRADFWFCEGRVSGKKLGCGEKGVYKRFSC